MKRLHLSIAAVLLLAPSVCLADVCFSNQKVTSVGSGYVEMNKGADGGDAVYFTLANGSTYPLNGSYNLDWNRGEALHRMLISALVGGHPITGHDHHGTKCDDIDEIWMSR